MQVRLVAPVLAVCAAYAQADTSPSGASSSAKLEEVIVTATRFEEASPKSRGNIFVLTREDIERTPASSVPDLLSGIPAIHVLPLYGALGIDSVVNLRGAGNVGTASSNTLVLLNGQRLNPIDSGSIDWSLVPIASIERIEVMPGSGTVLYGDRATGGVINIVTRKGETGSNVQLGFGSHGTREFSAQTRWETGAGDANVYVQYGTNDGWRKNSDQERYSAGGRIDFGREDTLRGFVDLGAFNERLGTPGALWQAEYDANPTFSRHPGDRSSREGFRIRPGVQMALSSNVNFEADLSLSKDDRSGYSGITNAREQTRNLSRDFVSFSPKLRASYLLGGMSNKATIGYDYYQGSANSKTLPVGYQEYMQNASQNSHAFYLQNVSEFDEHWALSLGWRSQRLKQSASQSAHDKTCYDPNNNWAPYSCIEPAMSGNSSSNRSAYEVGLSWQANGWRVYARSGLVYRFPNTDELYGLDPLTYDPTFAANLKPQNGEIREFGASLKMARVVYSFSLYQQDLKNEITSDPNGGNMNLAATRRRGMDLNAKLAFSDNLRGNFYVTRQESLVTEGNYAGFEVPAVPKILAGAALSWRSAQGPTWSARVNYVSERRYGDDYRSEAGYQPGYTTVDVSGLWQIHRWKIEARLMNLTNTKYAAFGGFGFNSALSDNDKFYYPADPRTFRVIARYDF